MDNSTGAGSGLADIKKSVEFVDNKIFVAKEQSLSYLFNEYFARNVVEAAKSTYLAKLGDIQDFLKFFRINVGVDDYELWTPSITKAYRSYIYNDLNLKPASVNRKLATLKHAANWIHKRFPFKWGTPFEGVKDIEIGVVGWKGLSDKEIMRLKAACDIRMASCKRKNQNPLLETTVFYVLLYTGLRETELCNLNIDQYNGKGFEYVKRKGNKVSEFVAVPKQAKEFLDRYLATRPYKALSDPLFLNIKKKRLRSRDVSYACTQIKLQVNAKLPPEEHSKFTPHSLRHAFLKRVADKLGIHAAHEMSGNVSIKEIYRYTRPSKEEMEQMVEDVFGESI